MSEQGPNCGKQALTSATVKAVDTLIKTRDPVQAGVDFCTTYTTAKGMCELTKESSKSPKSDNR